VSRVAQPLWCVATGRPGHRVSIPGRGRRIFLITSVPRPALWPTQPPVQWVTGVLSPRLKCGRGVTLTTQLHLVATSRMSRSYTSSPPNASVACSGTALSLVTFASCAFTEHVMKNSSPLVSPSALSVPTNHLAESQSVTLPN
jgi:hypothetical protein